MTVVLETLRRVFTHGSISWSLCQTRWAFWHEVPDLDKEAPRCFSYNFLSITKCLVEKVSCCPKNPPSHEALIGNALFTHFGPTVKLFFQLVCLSLGRIWQFLFTQYDILLMLRDIMTVSAQPCQWHAMTIMTMPILDCPHVYSKQSPLLNEVTMTTWNSHCSTLLMLKVLANSLR